MQFSEKLNFLMDITKTSNSALSRNASLDASYISRLRRGKRTITKNEDCLRSMSVYFSKRCIEDYQQKAIADALSLSSFPSMPSYLAETIAKWLLNENISRSERVENFLGGLSNISSKAIALTDNLQKSDNDYPHESMSVYYGIEGKRNAVKFFLSEVIACDKPQTLLLFSDEDTSWMTDDAQFSKEWAFLMLQTLSKGNRVKIIHTINRDLNEMLNAISHWMPLYMSGAIEPYFYPKKRDGIFKRTLFIAPKSAAIVSNSVGEMIGCAANVLYRDQKAVTSFELEFLQYLKLCRPLMRIFTGKDKEATIATLTQFELGMTNTLIKTESLSILTMPEDLNLQIASKKGLPDKTYIEFHKSRIKNFRQNLGTNSFTEIIHLPAPDSIINGTVKIALSDMLNGGAIYYTPEEYILHLENIIDLLYTFENYHIYILNYQTEDRYMVYAREELGVIVAKTSLPPVVLFINENNMTAAFWDFLKDIASPKAYENPNNIETAKRLKNYIHKLKECL